MEIAADVLVYLEMLLISEFAVALLVFPGVVADLEIASEAVVPDAVLVVMMLLLI